MKLRLINKTVRIIFKDDDRPAATVRVMELQELGGEAWMCARDDDGLFWIRMDDIEHMAEK